MSGIRKLAEQVWKHRPDRSTVLEVAGFVALVYGIGVMSAPLAFIVAGVLLIVAGGLSA